MKKLIFSLMLSTALFTPSPVFCMKNDRDELEMSSGLLCRLGSDQQLSVFKELDDLDSISAAKLTSKYYMRLIKSVEIPINLNIFYYNYTRSAHFYRAPDYRNFEFSLHVGRGDKEDKKFTSRKELTLSILQSAKNGFNQRTNIGEKKLKMTIFPLAGMENLEFLVKGMAENFMHIPLTCLGYKDYNVCDSVDYEKMHTDPFLPGQPPAIEKTHGSTFNFRIRIVEPIQSIINNFGQHWQAGSYYFCNSKEEKNYERMLKKKACEDLRAEISNPGDVLRGLKSAALEKLTAELNLEGSDE